MPDAPVQPGEPVLDTRLAAPEPVAPAPGPRFTVGGALSRTLRVWWAHLGAFTATSVVVYAPLLAALGLLFGWAMGAAEGRAPPTGELAPRLATLLAAAAVTGVLSVVQMGAVTYGTLRHLHGERAPFGQMVATGVRRGLPVVGTAIVVWLVTAAASLLLLVPGLVFLVAACVAIPAAVVERPGVVGAIRRSFELTRGSRWPLFATGLAVLGIVWVLSAIVQVGATALASLALSPAKAMAAMLVASQLGNALFSVLPVVAIAVCYHDLRLAKEGADTADLARVFE